MIDRRELFAGAAAGSALLAAGDLHAASPPEITSPSGGLRARYAFSVSVFFKERVMIDAPFRRAFVPAIGGEIWGPRLSGIVVPYGGADFGGGAGRSTRITCFVRTTARRSTSTTAAT